MMIALDINVERFYCYHNCRAIIIKFALMAISAQKLNQNFYLNS